MADVLAIEFSSLCVIEWTVIMKMVSTNLK